MLPTTSQTTIALSWRRWAIREHCQVWRIFNTHLVQGQLFNHKGTAAFGDVSFEIAYHFVFSWGINLIVVNVVDGSLCWLAAINLRKVFVVLQAHGHWRFHTVTNFIASEMRLTMSEFNLAIGLKLQE